MGVGIDPLINQMQQQLHQLPFCSPAAIASLSLVLGSGPYRDKGPLEALMHTLTNRYKDPSHVTICLRV